MSPSKKALADLDAVRAERLSLRAEARSFGVYVTSNALSDLRDAVEKIRDARQGKPPCYWRAYDKIARECRICDLRNDCARGDVVQEQIPTKDLRPSVCETCGGVLSVEIVDPASGRVSDYGCATPGCTGVLGDQTRFDPPAPPPVAAERVVTA